MVRVANTDIVMISTPLGAATKPSLTQVSDLITRIYKRTYTAVYGTGNYSADESTDTLDVIDTDDMKEVITTAVERITESWLLQGRSSGEGKHYPMPLVKYNKKELADIKQIVWRKVAVNNPIRTPQLWNEARDDVLVR